MAIFRIRCEKNGYRLSDEADKAAAAMFDRLYAERDENFGNGRDVRNFFEDAVTRQANRLAKLEAPSKDELMTLLPEDLEEDEEPETLADGAAAPTGEQEK